MRRLFVILLSLCAATMCAQESSEVRNAQGGGSPFVAQRIETGEIVVRGAVLAERLSHLRFAGAFAGVSATQQFDAAFRDCGQETCVVYATPGMSAGDPAMGTWKDNAAVVDMRYAGSLQGTGNYYSPFQVYQRKTSDLGTNDFYSAGRFVLLHYSGGSSDMLTGARKSTYYGLNVEHLSGGIGQEFLMGGEIYKYGSGEAFTYMGYSDHSGNCLSYGDECLTGIKTSVTNGDGYSLFTGTVRSLQTDGVTQTLAFSSSKYKNIRGEKRWIINTNPAKIYRTGEVVSVSREAPPMVTFSGTVLDRQFGVGVHNDLCFSQEADDDGIYQFVVPIKSIDSSTQLTLNYFVAGGVRVWGGSSGRSGFRIYRCAQIESFDQEGGKEGAGTLTLSKGSADWSAGDTFEQPLGFAMYVKGLRIAVHPRVPNSPQFRSMGIYLTNQGLSLGSGMLLDGKYHEGLTFANEWRCSVGGPRGSCATFGIHFTGEPPSYPLYFNRAPTEVLDIVDGNVTASWKYNSRSKSFQFYTSDAAANAIDFEMPKGTVSAMTITSRAATGAAPLVVSSTTEVTNLNAQRWHGREAVDFSAELHFPAIAGQSCSESLADVPGATPGAAIAPGWPQDLPAGLFGMMIAQTGRVRVRLCNATAMAMPPLTAKFSGRLTR